MRKSFSRYVTAYGTIYILNFLALVFFVDYLGLNHQVVQGNAILLSAIVLFYLQKFWVFKGNLGKLI
ncbi:MAG: GtrA family protein [bacterium]|nr:GtrA family protein [bacterium]